MAAGTKVQIKYGSYKTYCGIEHKKDRIKGLETYLSKLGYVVECTPIPYRNIVEIHVHDQNVFECDIRELQFGGDGELDELCTKAGEIIANL